MHVEDNLITLFNYAISNVYLSPEFGLNVLF